MIYAKLDVDFYDHPRFVKAGLAATGLWSCSLAYCRKHAFDGTHPGRFPKDVDFIRRPGGAAAAAKLLETGLWIDRGEDYELHNYEAKNETKDDIEVRRENDRIRQARARHDKKSRSGHVTSQPPVTGLVPGSGSGSVTVTGEGAGGGADQRPPDPNRATYDLAALERGVSGVTGGPCSLGRKWSQIQEYAELFRLIVPANCIDTEAFFAERGQVWAEWCEAKNRSPNHLTFRDWVSGGMKSGTETTRPVTLPEVPAPRSKPSSDEPEDMSPEQRAAHAKAFADALAGVGNGGVG